jgi:hypothetical protein
LSAGGISRHLVNLSDLFFEGVKRRASGDELTTRKLNLSGCKCPSDDFFRDFGFFELLTAPLGKSSESKETRKVTTLSLHPPPTGILFFTKKPGILASTTLKRNRFTFNSHTDAIDVSRWLDFICSLLVHSAWAAADSTALSTQASSEHQSVVGITRTHGLPLNERATEPSRQLHRQIPSLSIELRRLGFSALSSNRSDQRSGG